MAARVVLAPSTAHNVAGGKTIEETYQKKTQLEHILLRPDTYVGSVEKMSQPLWVRGEGFNIVQRQVAIVPGLYKVSPNLSSLIYINSL